MSNAYVIAEREGHIATITINRPDKLNALSSQVVRELTEAFHLLAEEPMESRIRVAILTGSGEKAFVAGADIAEMSLLSAPQAKAFADQGHRLGMLMESCSFPIIAAVNGFALGGGCELALCCDFIYASEKAKFAQPEVNLGVIPGFGGTQRLTRRIGPALARELIYSGDMITAQDALRLGLVNQVLSQAELMPKVREVAQKIAAKSPLAIAAAKRAIECGMDRDLRAANELEAAQFASLFGSHDQSEGMKAFLEKRKADFQGR